MLIDVIAPKIVVFFCEDISLFQWMTFDNQLDESKQLFVVLANLLLASFGRPLQMGTPTFVNLFSA